MSITNDALSDYASGREHTARTAAESTIFRALAAELLAWRECALYDATMEGPVFKGWDRSALERCRANAEGRK